MDTPRKETLFLIHNERLSHFQKFHSVVTRTRNCQVNQPWAVRTASLSSSFGNKSYCEPKITHNPAFLTHPVLSWNHSPQNEYKGDSCRVVALQLWKMCSVIVAWTSWCVPLNTSSQSVPFTSLTSLRRCYSPPPLFRGKTPYKSSPPLAPLGM